MQKKGLGKGLSTLFEEIPVSADENDIIELKTTDIEPNRSQPRKNFDKEKLNSLADSIKEHGVIQPIIVTADKSGRYTIVAGERRWRAAKIAGLKTVPVLVKDYSEQAVAEIALIENLQREDLNPIEEANGYKELCSAYGLTQDEISQMVGKSRSAVANSMRLLSLEEEIQQKLMTGEISEGHARAILSLTGYELRIFLTNAIIEQELNVREAEKLAKELSRVPKPTVEKKPDAYEIELKRIQDSLSSGLGTKVTISKGRRKGKIEIEFYSNEDLERLINLIKR